MRPVFIGDEVTGAAFRLAGFDAWAADAATAPALWTRALRQAPPLLLITAECASALPAEALDAALARLDPIVALVPDAGGRGPLPDLTGRVRGSLGIGGPDDGSGSAP